MNSVVVFYVFRFGKENSLRQKRVCDFGMRRPVLRECKNSFGLSAKRVPDIYTLVTFQWWETEGLCIFIDFMKKKKIFFE